MASGVVEGKKPSIRRTSKDKLVGAVELSEIEYELPEIITHHPTYLRFSISLIQRSWLNGPMWSEPPLPRPSYTSTR